MNRLRTIVGFASIACIAFSLNVGTFREDPFHPLAFAPLVIGLGLALVWLVLRLVTLSQEARGNTVSGVNSLVGSIVFLAICITLYAFVRRWDATWDLTKEGRTEFATQTVQVLENLDEDVNIYGFFKTSGDAIEDAVKGKVERFLDRCEAMSEHIKVEFIDPQQNPERLQALNVKRVSVVGTVVMKCGTRQREIPLSDAQDTLEEREFTNALINVVRDARPKVYFLTGHQERRIDDTDKITGASDLGLWLQKEAYDVDTHLIMATDPYIPDDCSLLVVNNYNEDFRPYEIEALDAYMQRGGRLMLMVDPSFVLPASPGQKPIERMRPWLIARYGVEIGSDFVVSAIGWQSGAAGDVMLIQDFAPLAAQLNLQGVQQEGFRGSFNAQHPITRPLDQQMVWKNVRSVGLMDTMPEGVAGTVLLRSTPECWAEKSVADIFQGNKIDQDPDEPRGAQPIAVAVTARTNVPVGDGSKMKGARLVVVGNSSFTASESIGYLGNVNFMLNAVAWLTESDDLIALRASGPEDQPIVLNRNEQRAIAWFAILGTAQAVAVAGFVVFLWRRRYR